jgi:hypothetical protein
MGLRSWLTPMKEQSPWEVIQSSIEENPYANGIQYVFKIEHEGTPFQKGSIIVAWSGDGSSSINELQPVECSDKTWLLDNSLGEYPAIHDEPGGPGKYGTFLENEEAVLRVFDTII